MTEIHNEEGQDRNFMSPIEIPDTIWQEKAASVQIRKTLFKAVSESNFLLY